MTLRALTRYLPLVVVALAVTAFAVSSGGGPDTDAPGAEPLTLFWMEGCPYCEAEWEFLAELQTTYPNLEIVDYEVSFDEANRALFVETLAERGMEAGPVPTTILGEHIWVGFDTSTASAILAAVNEMMNPAS
jgi:thiol-disulfide isomerase/thioredoxin